MHRNVYMCLIMNNKMSCHFSIKFAVLTDQIQFFFLKFVLLKEFYNGEFHFPHNLKSVF